MSKEFDKFSAGFDSMSMFDNDAVVERPKRPSSEVTSRTRKASRKQFEALREARKEKRGRGKSLGERRSIILRVTPTIDKAISDAMYDSGRTQNDVICDALISYLKIDI